MTWRGSPLFFTLLSIVGFAFAESPSTPVPEPLPDPLSLEAALALADAAHPEVASAAADVAAARARLQGVEARAGLRANLDLVPQRVEPSTGDGAVNDSYARVNVSKPLYDFGRTHAAADAARAEVESREFSYFDARQRLRLEVMRRFFDVVLADLRYAYDNEDMAHRFVNFDRARERHALGQVSDVDLAEAENRYREVLNRRTESQKRQTGSRLALALALNRPEQLVDELVKPALDRLDRETPDYKTLYEQALAANPSLAAVRQELAAARFQLQSERARRRPTVSAEIEAADYERDRASRDDVRASLHLRIPLYQGGEDSAAIERAAAEVTAREARLRRLEYGLRQSALDLTQELETLKIKRATAQQRVAFRDLALDRARALYEMEVQTSLGDALARLTEAQWLAAQADYELALAWAKVDAFRGALVEKQDRTEIPP